MDLYDQLCVQNSQGAIRLEWKILFAFLCFPSLKTSKKSPALKDITMKVVDTCGLWAAWVWRKHRVKTCNRPLIAKFSSIAIRAFLQIHTKNTNIIQLFTSSSVQIPGFPTTNSFIFNDQHLILTLVLNAWLLL